VGLKNRDLRIAREMKYTRKRTGSRISRRRNSIYAGGYRRMAVSYECEQCNSPRVPSSAGSVSSKRRAFARLPSLVPKPRGHGGTSNFAFNCESELDGRGTAPHVSSDQETWRPEVIPNNGQQSPLFPLHRQQQFRLPMHKALGASIIIDCRQWIHISRLRGRSED
jgi:hypothetical protein